MPMVVRVLLAVLVLVGQVPLRFCTCGADHIQASELAPDARPVDGFSVSVPGHDHDCQAHNPKPSFKVSLPVPGNCIADETSPTDSVALIDAWLPVGSATSGSTPYRPPDPSPVPLHITFLVLRN